MEQKTSKVNKQDKQDLQYFIFIYKRKPKDREEFELFQQKLNQREQEYIEDLTDGFTVESFFLTYTATRCKENPFISTQREYDGWSDDE